MPYRYKVSPQERRILTVFSGPLTGEELTEYARRPAVQPKEWADFDELLDLSGVGPADVHAEDIRAFARAAEASDRYRRSSQLAVVAPRDVLFGYARMFQTLRSESPQSIEIFRAREDAERWLAEDVSEDADG